MPASPRALPFDFLINLVCVAISALVFFYVPEGIDAKKPANSDSFWNLYLSGSLNHVPHITQLLVASAIANFFDMFVIYYHLTNPPHPKFVMIRPRRISIFLHLTSGIVEISSATAIIFVGNPDIHLILVRIMTAAAFVHASTAYYQTGLVFGAKGIMVPGYLYAITVHALNAYRLLYNPTSLVYVFKTFLTLSIYVWCRVFIFFFRALNMFTGYNYTISITLSGALLFPFALGPIGNYAFMGVVAVYNILHALVWSQEEDFAGFMFIEHERYTMVDANLFAEWKKKLSKTKSPNEIDRERAEVAFKSADTNNSKTLTIDEVQEMMKPLKLSQQVKQSIEKAVRENSKAKKGVDFDTFYRSVWNILNVHGRLEELPKNIGKLEPRKQAKAVFDRLDMDKSGQIDKTEIDFLLQVWGLPKTETDAYFAAYGIKGNKFDFEVFYKKMTPIWQFAVHEVSYDTQAPRVGAKTHMNKAE